MSVPAASAAQAELVGKTVADVVVRLPKCLPRGTSVGEARRAFDDDHVHMLLLTEGGRLLGTLDRDDLAGDLDDAAPALAHAVIEGRTIESDLPAEEARRRLVASGRRRVVVVDRDGALLGLLCLKRRLTGFCSDADVASRACDPSSPAPRPTGPRFP